MNNQYWPAVAGVCVAIAITATMDATGYSDFSALPLFPLFGLFWFLQGFSRSEIGLTAGNIKSYIWALAYPLAVLGAITAIAFVTKATDLSAADWNKTWTNVGLMSTVGILMGLMTEEGFFRGWLWASLTRAGCSAQQNLAWTTLAFVVWHISAISLDTGFDLPAGEIPIYLANATLLGLIWGILRLGSGSIFVAAVCHSVWNGLVYPLFGFGERVGALGIQATHIYGPEVGSLGIALNCAFLAVIWSKYATKFPKKTQKIR